MTAEMVDDEPGIFRNWVVFNSVSDSAVYPCLHSAECISYNLSAVTPPVINHGTSFPDPWRRMIVGTRGVALVYHVSPNIMVKAVEGRRSEHEQQPFHREIKFYERLNKRQDRCSDIIDCFLALPDHVFLSFCDLGSLSHRFRGRQIRETLPNGLSNRLVQVKEHEELALIL